MWSVESAQLDEGTLRWSGVVAAGGELSFGEVCAGWQADAGFRAFWIARLRTVPFGAYCWECPPVHHASRSRPFECVFIASPSLAGMPPDADAFAEHFRRDHEVVTFANLGGDALLVAPCPDESGANFSHLAGFTATAAPRRQDALWRAVGEALESRIGERPLWLSTAGHGVAWLHVRLDSRPKYYRYAPYRDGR